MGSYSFGEIYKYSGMKSDELDVEENCKDLIRQLLLRYGILFRDLLEREFPHMRWPKLFKTLRIMELSGQVVSGYFFEGIRGVQFLSKSAFSLLEKWEPAYPIYWMNACDPVSICGLKLEGLDYRLPSRIPSTHLVYHGKKLALVSRNWGRSLEFFVKHDGPAIPKYLSLFKSLSCRDFEPLRSVRVEKVNGIPVWESPYRDRLISYGFKRYPGGLIWHTEYATRDGGPTV